MWILDVLRGGRAEKAARKKAAKTEKANGRAAMTFPVRSAVAGVSFGERQKFLKKSKAGDAVRIEHAPVPSHPEAAAVRNARTEKQLGFVREELAVRLLSEFGEGYTGRGAIEEITGGTREKPTLGCNYRIDSIEERADK